MSPIEEFIRTLDDRLDLPSASKERVLGETRAHLVAGTSRYELAGCSREGAERRAVNDFGDVAAFAAQMNKDAVNHLTKWQLVGRGLAILAGSLTGFVLVTFGMWDFSEGVTNVRLELLGTTHWATPLWLIGGIGGGALIGSTALFRRWLPVVAGGLSGLFAGMFLRDQISLHPLVGMEPLGYRQPSLFVLLGAIVASVALGVIVALLLRAGARSLVNGAHERGARAQGS